jgi:hypothetical protein
MRIKTVQFGCPPLWRRAIVSSPVSFKWAAPDGKKVGTGWGFKDVFSGATLEP